MTCDVYVQLPLEREKCGSRDRPPHPSGDRFSAPGREPLLVVNVADRGSTAEDEKEGLGGVRTDDLT
jgi:hypothetical protein